MRLGKPFGQPGLDGPAPAPSPEPRRSGFSGSRLAYLLVSLAVLAPCYWQRRIHAGDLSSHIYNAWLAEIVQAGKMPGLEVQHQSTNVLFDLMLSAFFRAFGPSVAQRLAVSIAVVVFIWGAFAFIGVLRGRKPWNLMPCLAMIAYGYVFHMGFFNFYLSLGLCFWAMAFIWRGGAKRVVAGCGALALGCLAHALPVAWCCGVMAIFWLMRKSSPKLRIATTVAAVAALILLRTIILSSFTTIQTTGQILGMSGVDQLWVFGPRYLLLSLAMLVVWGYSLLRLAVQSGVRSVLTGIPLHLCIVMAAVVTLIPSTIFLPGYNFALSFIAERMSLPLAVCICGLLAGARPGYFDRGATMALAAVFFFFLFQDQSALNRMEDRMEGAVARLQPGQRVIGAVGVTDYRTFALTHMIDRVCLGRCYSYANYEPASWQFRVRALADNPYVVHRSKDSLAMETGSYRVADSDLPLYSVEADASGELSIRELKTGEICGRTSLKALPELNSAS